MQIEDLVEPDYLSSVGAFYEKEQFAVSYLWSVLELKQTTDEDRTNRSGFEAQRLLDEIGGKEGFLYYASDGTNVVTNTGQTDPAYYKEFSSYYLIDEVAGTEENFPEVRDGIDRRYYPSPVETADFEQASSAEMEPETERPKVQLYVALTDEYIRQRTAEYQAIADEFDKMAFWGVFGLGLLLCLLVYLFFVTGRKAEDEEVHMLAIDRMWSELTLLLAGTSAVLAVAGMVGFMTECYDAFLPEMFAHHLCWILFGAIGGLGLLAVELFGFSLVRKFKSRGLIRGSLCYIFANWMRKLWKKLCNAVGKSGSLSFRAVVLFLVLEAAFFLLAALTVGLAGVGWIAFLALIALNIYCILWIGKQTKRFQHILAVLADVRRGKTEEKLTVCEGVLGELAEHVNAVSDGIKEAVQREVKAERMKAELITNVSHDLKTPLTSIINYADLLKRETLEPAFANDYVQIIAQKGEKLKQLTQDLFAVSKAQSGNVEVRMEMLNLSLLLRQALAEVEDRMKAQSLEVIRHEEAENVFVMGDGRLLSRVVGNLLNNIGKYAMQGTRVYIEIKANMETVALTFKNIANYPMNFSEEEITERFVRGDTARTTEGSGLGLAIAKEYTALCGGTLQIQVDGDLFKAILSFPAVKQSEDGGEKSAAAKEQKA